MDSGKDRGLSARSREDFLVPFEVKQTAQGRKAGAAVMDDSGSGWMVRP